MPPGLVTLEACQRLCLTGIVFPTHILEGSGITSGMDGPVCWLSQQEGPWSEKYDGDKCMPVQSDASQSGGGMQQSCC